MSGLTGTTRRVGRLLVNTTGTRRHLPLPANTLTTITRSSTFTTSVNKARASANGDTGPMGIDITDRMAPAKPFKSIPGPRGIYNIPYLGFLFNLKPFGKYSIENIHLIFKELEARHGPIFRVQTNSSSVVITDPDDIATMFANQGRYPYRPNLDIYDVYFRRMGRKPNLGVAQNEDWWHLREPMQRLMLKEKNLAKYLRSVDTVVDEFVDSLANGVLDHHGVMETFIAFIGESVGTAFFNKRLGLMDANPTEESKKILQATHAIFELIFDSIVGGSFTYKFYRSKAYNTFQSAQNHIRVVVSSLVKEAKQELKRQELLGNDISDSHILYALLKEPTLEEEDVILIVEGLYFGAMDTSASALQLMFYLLAKNQDKQELLRQEILSVLGDQDNDIENGTDVDIAQQQHATMHAKLSKMHYLKASVKEVLRVLKIFPFGTIRVLPTDVVLSGYNVPAGVQIYTYDMKACNDDETLFNDPDSYIPERWLRSPGQTRLGDDDRKRKWAVLPFGHGVRSCPGRRLFEYETNTTLVKVLSKLRIGIKPECENTEFIYRFSLQPKTPIKFTFTPLNENC